MKISLDWLKDYVSVGISSEKLEHRLTMAGLEVEKKFQVGGDTVLEMEITPNRADCLSVWGIAREVSAILDKKLELPKVKKLKIKNNKNLIFIEDKKSCGAYYGTIIKNVKVKDSSSWMKKRLLSMGLRSINNVVDITNFCLFETGQPLHAFDYDKLEGGRVVVRKAKKGEKIITLDDQEIELDPTILIVADSKNPVAIAGVIGGKDTQVTAETKNILLESAYFDSLLIRRTSRKLGISTDSSYRFERGICLKGVETTSLRALSFLFQETKGTLSNGGHQISTKSLKKIAALKISTDQINQYLGSNLKSVQCKKILKALGFNVEVSEGSFKIISPDFRSDIRENVDVIEEIARVVGYDNLPLSLPQIKANQMVCDPRRRVKEKIRKSVELQGFSEVITFSMVNVKTVEALGENTENCLEVKNPLTQEQGIMRKHFLSSLLGVVETNINKGQKNLRIYEIGKTYDSGKEKEMIALLITGSDRKDWRLGKVFEEDVFDLKGVVEEIVKDVVWGEVQTKEINEIAWLDFLKGQSLLLKKDNLDIGLLGRVESKVLTNFGIKQKNVYYAEIELDFLYKNAQIKKEFVPLNEFPAIVRDVSLAVKQDVSYSQVKELILEKNQEWLTSIRFIELYMGDKLPKNHRGITFSLTYQSSLRTLTDGEVSSIHEGLCKDLVEKLGAIQR